MYPPYKQSGYEQGQNASAFDQASRWREPGQPQGWHQPMRPEPVEWAQAANWQAPAPAYADVHAHEVVWPPPSVSATHLHHAHIAPVPLKTSWPWRRSLIALSLTFAGGVFARPMLEHQARALPGEVAVVGHHLVELLPNWAQAQFTPTVTRKVVPAAPARIVTTPLPTPKVSAPPAAAPPPSAPAADVQAVAATARVPEPVAAKPTPAPAVEAAARHEAPHHGHASRASRISARVLAKLAARTGKGLKGGNGVALAMATPAAEPAAAAPAPAPPAPVRRAGPADSLDNLMARAMHEPDPSEAKAAAAPVQPGDKPGALDRGQIVDVMKGLVAGVNACGTELVRPTNADLTITVEPSGSVSAVKVAGPLFASLTAGCVVRTVKTATFPASRGMTFSYRYTVKPTGRSASTALAEPARPERITGTASSGQAPPTLAAPAERPRDLSVLPNLPSKVKVSDDPLAGVAGRSVEGTAKRKNKQK